MGEWTRERQADGVRRWAIQPGGARPSHADVIDMLAEIERAWGEIERLSKERAPMPEERAREVAAQVLALDASTGEWWMDEDTDDCVYTTRGDNAVRLAGPALPAEAEAIVRFREMAVDMARTLSAARGGDVPAGCVKCGAPVWVLSPEMQARREDLYARTGRKLRPIDVCETHAFERVQKALAKDDAAPTPEPAVVRPDARPKLDAVRAIVEAYYQDEHAEGRPAASWVLEQVRETIGGAK